MSTQVMNSAMMPAEGIYNSHAISQQEFVSMLVDSDEIVSSVGYPSTVELIKRLAGITLPLSRELTVLSPEDVILVIKLKYRIDNPSRKKDWKPRDDDYEYFLVEYRPHGHHTIHIDIEDDMTSNRCPFILWIDGQRFLGSDVDEQRIAHHVWETLDCPDLLNDYCAGVSLTFDSDEEFRNFVMYAKSLCVRDAA